MDTVLEEGEILDYEPLPRPSVNFQAAKNSFRTNAGTCTSESSDSSDSENGGIKRKRPKIQNIKDSSRNNKYNVWSSEFQTSELMDDICNWDSGLKNRVMDKSRSVESYYHFPEEREGKEEEEEEEGGVSKHPGKSDVRKRHFGEVVDLRTKLGKRPHKDANDPKSNPRYLTELKVTANDSIEDITRDITLKLCEEKEDLILRIVTVLGKEKALDMFNRTRDIEKDGGMMVMNGSRRRTPGGVLLQLIKKDDEITRDQRNNIFVDDQKVGNKTKKLRGKSKKQKNASEEVITMQTDTEENLPVLLDRKDLVLSATEPENNSESAMASTNKTPVAQEHADPRKLAVYEDIFDDDSYDIEFI